MNLTELQDQLRAMPVQALQQYANGMNPEVPPWLALSVLQQKQMDAQRQQVAQGAAQGQMPTIKDKVEQSAGLMGLMQGRQQDAAQQQAAASMRRPGAAPGSVPQPEAQPEPQTMMRSGGIVGLKSNMKFARGGIVGFAAGDYVGVPQEVVDLVMRMKKVDPNLNVHYMLRAYERATPEKKADMAAQFRDRAAAIQDDDGISAWRRKMGKTPEAPSLSEIASNTARDLQAKVADPIDRLLMGDAAVDARTTPEAQARAQVAGAPQFQPRTEAADRARLEKEAAARTPNLPPAAQPGRSPEDTRRLDTPEGQGLAALLRQQGAPSVQGAPTPPAATPSAPPAAPATPAVSAAPSAPPAVPQQPQITGADAGQQALGLANKVGYNQESPYIQQRKDLDKEIQDRLAGGRGRQALQDLFTTLAGSSQGYGGMTATSNRLANQRAEEQRNEDARRAGLLKDYQTSEETRKKGLFDAGSKLFERGIAEEAATGRTRINEQGATGRTAMTNAASLTRQEMSDIAAMARTKAQNASQERIAQSTYERELARINAADTRAERTERVRALVEQLKMYDGQIDVLSKSMRKADREKVDKLRGDQLGVANALNDALGIEQPSAGGGSGAGGDLQSRIAAELAKRGAK